MADNGLVRQGDLAAIAAMYVQAFPSVVARRFAGPAPALAFYADLFALVLETNGATFFAAREGGTLVGFAAVTWPDARLTAAVLRRGRWWRWPLRALGGSYGFRPRFAANVLRELIVGPRLPEACAHRPCLYAIAVGSGSEGKGVGRALMRRVTDAASATGLWLLVDADNARAQRLYTTGGFRTIGLSGGQDVMLWEPGAA